MSFSFLKNIFQTKGASPAKENAAQELPPANPVIAYKRAKGIPDRQPACLAPWTSISFSIDGYATACCLNRKTSVSVVGKTIHEIWNSPEFLKLRERIAADDLDYDCAVCSHQIHGGNFSGVKLENYESYRPYDGQYPIEMEFCLENTCNLECKMCNSLLSSSIRNREKLSPIHKYYGDSFVEDLEQYIPHLRQAIFAGGEPFLIPLYFKIWDKIMAINPKVIISIVTNGSTLNSRIKDLMERGNFRISVSIDSVHKETYESIRRNASFDTLLKNFEWYREYGERKKLPLNIPACPLTINWQGLPDIVRFANQKNVSMNFVYVDRPVSLALTHADPDFLQQIIENFRQQKFEDCSNRSKGNIARFNGLIEDLVNWRETNIRNNTQPFTGDLLQILEQRINQAENFQADGETIEEARQKMMAYIRCILAAVKPDKHIYLWRAFNTYSVDRLYSFLNSKTEKEMVLFFKEYIG